MYQAEEEAGALPEAALSRHGSSSSRRSLSFAQQRRSYGSRLVFSEDKHRMDRLKREWFHGKRCLDIGCNSGKSLTIPIAKRYSPLFLVGIDIDEDCISVGRSFMRTEAKAARAKARLSHSIDEQAPMSEVCRDSENPLQLGEYPFNIGFRCEDFTDDVHPDAEYDTILCSRVTKWIHFTQGDAGIFRLFQRVSRSLARGGVFVLEPQPWQSYRKDRGSALVPLSALRFHPNEFLDYLCGELGFRFVDSVQLDTADQRCFYVLQKPL